MNCVEYAINSVMNSDIPDYLLKLGFENANANYNGNWYGVLNQSTIEHGIRDQVIHKVLLPKCQVNGGQTEYIDLSGARMRDLGMAAIEVNVPMIFTGGRRITGVVEVYLGAMNSTMGMINAGVNTSGPCGQGAVNDMTSNLIDSLSPSRNFPPVYSNVRMTGVNTFVIFGLNAGTFSMTAKCFLEYDEGLSGIVPRHYDAFAQCARLATKAYLYRTCKYPVDEAVIRSGVTLDAIKDDISEYRDAYNEFEEYFDQNFKKRMAYSDRIGKVNSTRMVVPRRM